MLRIALAQTRQTDDFDDNVAAIFEAFDEAAGEGAQVVCFPEAQTVGYRVDVTAADAPVPTERLEQVHEQLAARCAERGVACILGTETPAPDGGKPFNSALVIDEHGRVLGTHHKSTLTPLDAVGYSPGDGTFRTFTLHGVKVGVVICFEGFRFASTTEACVVRRVPPAPPPPRPAVPATPPRVLDGWGLACRRLGHRSCSTRRTTPPAPPRGRSPSTTR